MAARLVYKNGMEILAPADVGPLLIVALSVASFVTAFIGVFTGAAGGVILLGFIIPQTGGGVYRVLPYLWRL